MKSALLATIFGIIGGVAILLAVPEEKTPVIKIQPVKSFQDYGEPVVPQIEETPPQEGPVHEPMDRYLSAPAKTEKTGPRHDRHVVPPAAKLLREASCRIHQTPKTSGGEISL